MSEEAEHIEEIEFETTSRVDYIQCAYFALSATDEIDLELISKDAANKIKRTRRRSIAIIDNIIDELYNELFENDTTD